MFRAGGRFVDLTAVSAAVAVCILFVDRSLALWLDARVYGSTLFRVGELILWPLDSILVSGAVLLVAALAWRRFFSVPDWVNRLVVGGIGAAVALLSALLLKIAIGRSQVYPLFLHDHLYELAPFAGAESFMAFPSATMAGVGAFVFGVGLEGRPQRAAAAVMLITLALALLVTGSHWLSDILAGTYVGGMSGAAVARRLRRATG
jgi:hypothetical protein